MIYPHLKPMLVSSCELRTTNHDQIDIEIDFNRLKAKDRGRKN